MYIAEIVRRKGGGEMVKTETKRFRVIETEP